MRGGGGRDIMATNATKTEVVGHSLVATSLPVETGGVRLLVRPSVRQSSLRFNPHLMTSNLGNLFKLTASTVLYELTDGGRDSGNDHI